VAIGPATDDEAAAIVAALQAGEVDVVVAGYWAIVAFEGEKPTSEGQAWLLKHPRVGPTLRRWGFVLARSPAATSDLRTIGIAL
jgi:hypothetical protein